MNTATPSPLQRALPWLGMAVAVAASLLVFRLYAHPEFMRGVADMVWGCF
jgi:hypothetical protein